MLNVPVPQAFPKRRLRSGSIDYLERRGCTAPTEPRQWCLRFDAPGRRPITSSTSTRPLAVAYSAQSPGACRRTRWRISTRSGRSAVSRLQCSTRAASESATISGDRHAGDTPRRGRGPSRARIAGATARRSSRCSPRAVRVRRGVRRALPPARGPRRPRAGRRRCRSRPPPARLQARAAPAGPDSPRGSPPARAAAPRACRSSGSRPPPAVPYPVPARVASPAKTSGLEALAALLKAPLAELPSADQPHDARPSRAAPPDLNAEHRGSGLRWLRADGGRVEPPRADSSSSPPAAAAHDSARARAQRGKKRSAVTLLPTLVVSASRRDAGTASPGARTSTTRCRSRSERGVAGARRGARGARRCLARVDISSRARWHARSQQQRSARQLRRFPGTPLAGLFALCLAGAWHSGPWANFQTCPTRRSSSAPRPAASERPACAGMLALAGTLRPRGMGPHHDERGLGRRKATVVAARPRGRSPQLMLPRALWLALDRVFTGGLVMIGRLHRRRLQRPLPSAAAAAFAAHLPGP